MLDLTREITIQDLIDQCGLTMTVDTDPDPKGEREKFMPRGRHYLCTLRIKGSDAATRQRALTLPFSLGSARTGEPDVAEVVESLVMDVMAFQDASDMRSWASEMGYDLSDGGDEALARRDYRKMEQWARKVAAWLPDGVTVDHLRED